LPSHLSSLFLSPAQAQAMVQAAAQAQAVVAAAKSRGDGLVPMNAAQIAALSQIQAQAIVHARKSQGTASQIQTQIQLQAQALVHAHTQAQIQAGIFKGDEAKEGETTAATATSTPAAVTAPAAATASVAASVATQNAQPVMTNLTPPQLQQQEDLKRQQEGEKQQKIQQGAPQADVDALEQQHQQQTADLHASFRKQNVAAVYSTVANPVTGSAASLLEDAAAPAPSSNSPQFLAQLNGSLDAFWSEALEQIQNLGRQTEQDFKNHNDLPLARIKRIMKSDEDVRMISAEAPVLFAKACELFILDLSIRSWNYSQLHKRRTLQKEDVKEAIQKTDVFDFLVDVIQ